MIKKIAITAASLAALSVTAVAADMGETSHDWTGFYLGVTAGGGAFEGRVVDQGGDALDTDGQESNLNGFAAMYGATAGYNYQFDSVVLGLEADINGSNWDESKQFDDDYRVESSLNWLGTIRGRAGVAVNNGLIYVTAGVGYANFNGCASDDEDTCKPDDDEIVNFEGGAWGMAAGVGTEWMLSDNLSMKGEYLYFQSAEKTESYDSDTPSDKADFSISSHIARVGLNYRF